MLSDAGLRAIPSRQRARPIDVSAPLSLSFAKKVAVEIELRIGILT